MELATHGRRCSIVIPVPSKSLYKLLDSVKSLCQIGDDVIDVLGADG